MQYFIFDTEISNLQCTVQTNCSGAMLFDSVFIYIYSQKISNAKFAIIWHTTNRGYSYICEITEIIFAASKFLTAISNAMNANIEIHITNVERANLPNAEK